MQITLFWSTIVRIFRTERERERYERTQPDYDREGRARERYERIGIEREES